MQNVKMPITETSHTRRISLLLFLKITLIKIKKALIKNFKKIKLQI
jgi:hypothetical protein